MTLHKWFYLIGMTTQHFHYVRTIYISIKQISVNHHDPARTKAWSLMQCNVSRFYTIICNFVRQRIYKPTYKFIKLFKNYSLKYISSLINTLNELCNIVPVYNNKRKKVQYWNYYPSPNYLLVDLLLFQLMLKFLGREWNFFQLLRSHVVSRFTKRLEIFLMNLCMNSFLLTSPSIKIKTKELSNNNETVFPFSL